MSIFQNPVSKPVPHSHATDEHCPWCDQPVPNDKYKEITERFAAGQREQHAALMKDVTESFERDHATALKKAAEDAAAREKLAVEAARVAAEAAMSARLVELDGARQSAEDARRQVALALDAAKADAASREATLAAKELELRTALDREKMAAVLAEQAKTFEERQRLQTAVEDLKRQLENKTAQEIGEGAEIDLFETLKGEFEEDRLRRVEKGAAGADVIHDVYANGRLCGRIIYDSKKHNAWRNDFVTKLRQDQVVANADHAVLSSHKLPGGQRQIYLQDGVIVANPARVLVIVQLLRRHIIQTSMLRLSNEARSQKTAELYEFMLSERCGRLLGAIATSADTMLDLDTEERKKHESVWKRRTDLIRSVQRAHGDLTTEVARIIGAASELSPTTTPADDADVPGA